MGHAGGVVAERAPEARAHPEIGGRVEIPEPDSVETAVVEEMKHGAVPADERIDLGLKVMNAQNVVSQKRRPFLKENYGRMLTKCAIQEAIEMACDVRFRSRRRRGAP
jgi:hypothetical protein